MPFWSSSKSTSKPTASGSSSSSDSNSGSDSKRGSTSSKKSSSKKPKGKSSTKPSKKGETSSKKSSSNEKVVGRRWTCPLRVALRRSWSGCHVNMAKIDWPDFCTDGLIVVWRKDEELIALPIRNGRVGFGIHELQGQGASLLQQRGFTEQDTKTLKNMLESKFAGMCLKSRAEKDKEYEERHGGAAEEPHQHGENRARHNNQSSADSAQYNENNNEELSHQITEFIHTRVMASNKKMRRGDKSKDRKKSKAREGRRESDSKKKTKGSDIKEKSKLQDRLDVKPRPNKKSKRRKTKSTKPGDRARLIKTTKKEKSQHASLDDTYQGVSSLKSVEPPIQTNTQERLDQQLLQPQPDPLLASQPKREPRLLLSQQPAASQPDQQTDLVLQTPQHAVHFDMGQLLDQSLMVPLGVQQFPFENRGIHDIVPPEPYLSMGYGSVPDYIHRDAPPQAEQEVNDGGVSEDECGTSTPSWLNHSLPCDIRTSSVFSFSPQSSETKNRVGHKEDKVKSKIRSHTSSCLDQSQRSQYEDQADSDGGESVPLNKYKELVIENSDQANRQGYMERLGDQAAIYQSLISQSQPLQSGYTYQSQNRGYTDPSNFPYFWPGYQHQYPSSATQQPQQHSQQPPPQKHSQQPPPLTQQPQQRNQQPQQHTQQPLHRTQQHTQQHTQQPQQHTQQHTLQHTQQHTQQPPQEEQKQYHLRHMHLALPTQPTPIAQQSSNRYPMQHPSRLEAQTHNTSAYRTIQIPAASDNQTLLAAATMAGNNRTQHRSGRTTPFTAYLNQYGVQQPYDWLVNKAKQPIKTAVQIREMECEKEQGCFPRGSAAARGVRRSSSESSQYRHHNQNNSNNNYGNNNYNNHNSNNNRNNNYNNHNSNNNRNNNYKNHNSSNNSNDPLSAVSEADRSLSDVRRSYYTDTSNELLNELLNKNNNGNQFTRHKHERSLLKVTINNNASIPDEDYKEDEFEGMLNENNKDSSHKPILDECFRLDKLEEGVSCSSRDEDHKKTGRLHVNGMEFLSALVNEMPVAGNESQSDASFDDLDISDDSVLDDLYTGLPPSQFRRSNMRTVLDRVSSDLPHGLIKSDYMYQSAEPLSLSLCETKPAKKTIKKRRSVSRRREKNLLSNLNLGENSCRISWDRKMSDNGVIVPDPSITPLNGILKSSPNYPDNYGTNYNQANNTDIAMCTCAHDCGTVLGAEAPNTAYMMGTGPGTRSSIREDARHIPPVQNPYFGVATNQQQCYDPLDYPLPILQSQQALPYGGLNGPMNSNVYEGGPMNSNVYVGGAMNFNMNNNDPDRLGTRPHRKSRSDRHKRRCKDGTCDNGSKASSKASSRCKCTRRPHYSSDSEYIYDEIGNVLFEILPYKEDVNIPSPSSPHKRHHSSRRYSKKQKDWMDFIPSDEWKTSDNPRLKSRNTFQEDGFLSRAVKQTKHCETSRSAGGDNTERIIRKFSAALGHSMSSLYDKLTGVQMKRHYPRYRGDNPLRDEDELFKYQVGWNQPLDTNPHIRQRQITDASRREFAAGVFYDDTEPINVNLFRGGNSREARSRSHRHITSNRLGYRNKVTTPNKETTPDTRFSPYTLADEINSAYHNMNQHNNNLCSCCSHTEKLWFSNKNNNAVSKSSSSSASSTGSADSSTKRRNSQSLSSSSAKQSSRTKPSTETSASLKSGTKSSSKSNRMFSSGNKSGKSSSDGGSSIKRSVKVKSGETDEKKEESKSATREQLLKVMWRSPVTRNRKGRKPRLVFNANMELRSYCRNNLRHLTYQGYVLCELRKEIRDTLQAAGYKIRPGLESFIPLWRHLEEVKSGLPLRLPPIVILDSCNRIKGYHPGGEIDRPVCN